MKLSICCLLLAVLLSPFISFAQTPSGQLGVPSTSTDVPKLVRFSGTAMDETGKPFTGVLGVTFSLYKDQQGGAPLWVETQNVQADANGHYTTLLGSASVEGVPLSLFSSGEAQWLGVQVQGQPAQPRVLLVSVPYALKAHEAETLSGKSISDFVLLNKSAAAPILLRSRAFHVRSGTRSLYLPCRSAPELRRSKSSQSRLDLHRDTQTVWPVPAPAAVHQCGFPLLGHPSARTSTATRPGVGEHS
jgi:hypothetical protein